MAISICRRYSSRTYALPRARPPAAGRSTAISSSSGAGDGLARPGEQLVDARPRARRSGPASDDRGAEADQRRAGVHRRRRVHDVAADRALGPRGVRADDRRGVGEARRSARAPPGGRRARACVASAPRRSPPPRPSMPRRASMPWMADDALRQRRLALAGADHEVGAAGDRARAGRRAPARPRLDRSSRRRTCRSSPVLLRRAPHALRRHRQLLDVAGRRPCAMALPTAPEVGHARRLADALRALRPGVRRRRSRPSGS